MESMKELSAVKPKQVTYQIDLLARKMDELDDAISRQDNMLRCVLRDVESESAVDCVEDRLVPLAERLMNLNNRLDIAIERITSITDRLEL